MGLSDCPPADRLRQLLGNSLPADEQSELIAHLDVCAACQEILEMLTGANSSLLSAAVSLQNTTVAEESPLRHVLNQLKTDANLTALHRPEGQTAWVQSLLQPAASLDVLGQLDAYEVTELLGQGGMGLVLKAYDPALHREVAIKVLSPHLAGDVVARQRFAREARAAAAVRHENVVTIHAVSEAKGLPFLVMEYVAGGSLESLVREQGPPDTATIARLGMQIAAGLGAAHAQGLIHRDIKPANILLVSVGSGQSPVVKDRDGHVVVNGQLTTGNWQPKITDFGLARAADESRLTQTGIIAGTPMYMAPEQALGEALDFRTDLFSLGSVLYNLCTGKDPFPGNNPLAVLRHVSESTPKPIRDINPAIPPWLAAIVERLQAKRPMDRFASATEVAELLQYHLKNPDVPAPVFTSARLPQQGRRRWLIGTSLLVILLALSLGLSEGLGWTGLSKRWFPPAAKPESTLSSRATLEGHHGPLWSVAYAPDGKTLATASDDSTVRLWDAGSGREVGILEGHQGGVFSAAFFPSGKTLASGGADGTLRIWDISGHKEISALSHSFGDIRRLAVSPDGKTVAAGGSAQGVELWDVESGKVRKTIHGKNGTISVVAFAPDGKTVATADSGGYITFWDPDSGSERTSFRADSLQARALVYSSEGTRLATMGSGDKGIKLWNVATHQPAGVLPGSVGGDRAAAFSRDGRWLAAGGREGTLTVWDLAAARPIASVKAHAGSVASVVFSPDDRTLVSVGEDRVGHLWDLSRLPRPTP